MVGDLDELKKKDYPELNKLKITLGDKKVSKGKVCDNVANQIIPADK